MFNSENHGRVVLGGAGGFLGSYLVRRFRERGREVITIGRSGADISWGDDQGIAEAVDGASLVIGMAGKNVSCRYNDANRSEIMRSRVDTTAALSAAIAAAKNPPPLWINSSTATIYRHADDRPMTESDGEIGTGFSVGVATAWEAQFFAEELPQTRRVALRTAFVLGHGSVLTYLKRLAYFGVGGAQLDGWWPVSRSRIRVGAAHYPGTKHGMQRFSWIHIEDLARIIDFVESDPELSGPVNTSAPNPVPNRELMATIRKILRVPFGIPIPRFMLELGAIMLRTETELMLKSRWVLPERLEQAGFEFQYPTLESALREELRGAQ